MDTTYLERLEEINPRLYALFEKCAEKIVTKNHDYAGANADFYKNLRGSEEWGFPGWKSVFVRLGDKIARIKNFVKNEVFWVSDEDFTETCVDSANYFLIMADMRELDSLTATKQGTPENIFDYPTNPIEVPKDKQPLEFRDLLPMEYSDSLSTSDQTNLAIRIAGILGADFLNDSEKSTIINSVRASYGLPPLENKFKGILNESRIEK